MNKFSRFLGLFFYFLFSNVYAAAATDLTQVLNNVHSMRANFTQTVYDNLGKAIQQSTGKMAMQRPGQFRWQVVRPLPQLIIANQTRLWIYDPDLEQVTIRAFKTTAGEIP